MNDIIFKYEETGRIVTIDLTNCERVPQKVTIPNSIDGYKIDEIGKITVEPIEYAKGIKWLVMPEITLFIFI